MRFLTHLKVAGTGSFRLAASQLFGYGGNAQNSDKETIDIFSAPPGYSIVQVDQAGAEALVVAYLAPPGRYRNLFIHKVKPHIYVALHLFMDKFRGEWPAERYYHVAPQDLRALPEWQTLADAITNSKFEYDIGKRTGHASNYKMGPVTFRDSTLKESEGTLLMTLEQSRYFLETYKALFPEIVELQNETIGLLHRYRVLHNLQGYPRRFERIITDGYEREAISWRPQSTVGCITHIAYRRMYEYIVANRAPWRLINNKHDSYAVLVPDADAVAAGRLMVDFMAQKLVGRDGVEFTMRSEMQIGKNFKKASDKNPLGMKEFKL